MGHAHNLYLNIAAETGLLGLGAYLVLVLAIVYVGRRALRNRGDRAVRALAVGILGSLAAYSIHNLFDMLFVQGMGVLLGLLLALLEHAARRPEADDRGGGQPICGRSAGRQPAAVRECRRDRSNHTAGRRIQQLGASAAERPHGDLLRRRAGSPESWSFALPT